MQINFTNIQHEPRKKLGLTMNEYAVAELIYQLSNNPKGDIQGWCYASKETMGDMLDLARKNIHVIINKLVEKGLVEKHENTKHLRTSLSWYNSVVVKITNSNESLHPVTKSNTHSNESLHHDSNESLHNNNNTNNDNNNNTTNVVLKAYGNGDINTCCKYFLERMQIPKEDCTQEQSRRYWNLLLKESKTGCDGVRWLIDIAANDEYYKHNTSSSKDLYYKRTKLIMRVRGNRPKVATMPTEGGVVSEQEELASNNRAQSLLAVREGENVLLPSG